MKVDIPCTCSPKANGEPRHEHDTVVLRDRLDLVSGLSIRNAIVILKTEDPGSGAAEVLASMSVQYLVHGIESWTRVDAQNKRIEADKTEIRQWIDEHDDIVSEYLVNPANDLYSERHLGPLVRAVSGSSPPSPIPPSEETSTSAPTGSEAKPRRRSPRSSTITTPTDGITPITSRRAGGSNTSQKSA